MLENVEKGNTQNMRWDGRCGTKIEWFLLG
jgi:hypothetical protein